MCALGLGLGANAEQEESKKKKLFLNVFHKNITLEINNAGEMPCLMLKLVIFMLTPCRMADILRQQYDWRVERYSRRLEW